jgi:hypothetical protein
MLWGGRKFHYPIYPYRLCDKNTKDFYWEKLLIRSSTCKLTISLGFVCGLYVRRIVSL